MNDALGQQMASANNSDKKEVCTSKLENLLKSTNDTTRFFLPKPCDILPKKLRIGHRKEAFLFPELYERLSTAKSIIDEGENIKHWDRAKRKTNPYELVHVLGTNYLNSEKESIIINSEIYSPLSRAFFKMIELYDECDIIPENNKKTPGQIAFLAEGPGGFMEALFKRRHIKEKIKDIFHGLTLSPHNKNIPGWSQLQRRQKHPLHNQYVHLHTGNLYKSSTLYHFTKNFCFEKGKNTASENNKAFLVTCDGGFDYSQDFNNQEKSSFQIIFSEITMALMIQKQGGTLVCKMFDILTFFSAQLVYLLTFLYEEVSLFKPKTSRPANSEKYLVAKRFRGISNPLLTSMINIVQGWKKITKPGRQINDSVNISPPWEESIFSPLDPHYKIKQNPQPDLLDSIYFDNVHMSPEYQETLKNINEYLTKRQENYIHSTINFITTPSENKEGQISQAIYWFHTHGILTKAEIRSCNTQINYQIIKA